jgi:hypothetical protein
VSPAHAARTVAANANGRLEVFLVGADGALYHAAQTGSAPDAWTPFSALGGALAPGPVGVGRAGDGRLTVFARGADNAIWTASQTTPGGAWGGFSSLGGVLGGSPEVGSNADGRLEIFVRGTNNVQYHRWQLATGGWSGWASMGGNVLGDTSVAHDPDGRMEVFARGTDQALGSSSQTAVNGGWAAWTSRGGALASDPSAVEIRGGRLEVFARGTDNSLVHVWQPQPGKWGAFESLGGRIEGVPAVARDASGFSQLFMRAGSNELYHLWQNPPAGAWSSFTSTGTRIVGDPVMATDGAGRLHVFALGPDGGLLHSYQTGPAPTDWSPAASLGLPAPGVAAAPTPNATLRRIVVALSYRYSAGRKSTRIKRLSVKLVPRGATVTATCTKGCSRKRLVTRHARHSTVSLTKLVRKPLRVGRKIKITVSLPGQISAVKTLTVRRRHEPSVRTRCLAPGARRPTRC